MLWNHTPLFLISSSIVLVVCILWSPATAGESWPLGIEPDFSLSSRHPFDDRIVALGKRLFFDKRLSSDQSLSCAGCHDPEKGFSNGKQFGVGVGGALGSRNVPTILNRLFGRSQFWDGRAVSLEAQALGPLFAEKEMAMNPDLLQERLSADSEYLLLFSEIFDASPSPDLVAAAIAAYERTLITGSTAFDRYEWGGDKNALSPSAKRGLTLFRGKARCNTCHTGTNFSDEKFHNLGVDVASGKADPGSMAVTGLPEDQGKFKTPTLRNLALTGPYMHDGSLASLQEVIDYYDRGCEANPNLDKEILPLQLSDEEKADLGAFLESLNGPILEMAPATIKENAY